MQDMVTPETLDELDRRVYDLAIQSIPLAEIAVRLGVPVGQADERIQRVCARLGVANRAGLRDWRSPALRESTPEPVIGAAVPPLETRHSRRSFVIAAGVIGVVGAAGAAAAAYALRDGGL